jgi:hypothetical protein
MPIGLEEPVARDGAWSMQIAIATSQVAKNVDDADMLAIVASRCDAATAAPKSLACLLRSRSALLPT